MLEADRGPTEGGTDDGRVTGIAGASLDQRLDPAEARRVGEQPQAGEERLGLLGGSGDLEREHRPAAPRQHLRRPFVFGVARQTGVVDGGHKGVRGEAARELRGRCLRAVEPDRERAEASQREKRLERARDGPVVVAERGEGSGVRLIPADRRPQEQIRVAADELRRRVHDEVRTEVERTLAQRRREGRVDDGERSAGPRTRGDGGHVRNDQERVGDRLQPDQIRAVGRGEECVGVVGRREADAESARRLEPAEDRSHPVVGQRREHDGAARWDEVGDRGHRREPRRERDRATPVESAERRLERTVGRAPVAAVLERGVMDVRRAHAHGKVHRRAGLTRRPPRLHGDGLGRPSRVEGEWRGIERLRHGGLLHRGAPAGARAGRS